MALTVTNLVAVSVHIVIVWLLLSNTCYVVEPKASQLYPAILIFGDSTVDTGNNNYIHTLFKANYPPYGRNFPGQIPTGRFSDGKLAPDILASSLGIKKLVPPFLDPTLSDDELKTGVSFASAGSGFDNLTTTISNVIPVLKQIDLFKSYISRLERVIGEEEAKKILNGALVFISAGSNDFILNFYDIRSIRSLKFNISGYQDFLQDSLRSFIKELYRLGCRNIMVAGVPPIGCLPIQQTLAFQDPKNRKCLENQNMDSKIYNEKLTRLLHSLQAPQLHGSKISYADIYNPLIDMINHPQRYGFEQTNKGCCGTGLVEAGPLCNPVTPTCEEPSKYVFWDSVHCTESTYKYISQAILKQLNA